MQTVHPRRTQNNLPPVKGVKNILAVASGKGGVGKSTVAVNLALALTKQGARVGILDADIYGPSIPTMLGITTQPESKDGKSLEPIDAYGLQVMSMGLLVEADSAMIWRGPIVSKALQQMLYDTHWQDLDYLIIDLPPGTGDIQLTMAQKIPVSGGIIVTTPQDIALQDAVRALHMFKKVGIAVLGVVENMSLHHCSHCGHEEAIFGMGGGAEFAKQYEVELLGQLPLDRQICQLMDKGQPIMASQPESLPSQHYLTIAEKLVAVLSARPKNYAGKFPTITLEETK